MISEVLSKFDSLGIPHQEGLDTDISIDCEFLDASWKTGNKKIKYDASVFFDENLQTVFMWEMTKEIGSGISFGTSSESTFQSGTTLYRKVKSVQYGPDGKAYEYSLDLGSIPKSVKETAKANGWSFKIVLKRDKALNSDAFSQSQKSAQIPSENNNIQIPEQKIKNSPVFYLPLIILIAAMIVFFVLGDVSLMGWGFGIVLFLALFLGRRMILKAGCLWKILIWICVTVVLFGIFALGQNPIK
jgi:hypothetical protein